VTRFSRGTHQGQEKIIMVKLTTNQAHFFVCRRRYELSISVCECRELSVCHSHTDCLMTYWVWLLMCGLTERDGYRRWQLPWANNTVEKQESCEWLVVATSSVPAHRLGSCLVHSCLLLSHRCPSTSSAHTDSLLRCILAANNVCKQIETLQIDSS